MFDMIVTMSYGTFYKWNLVAMAAGAALVGGFWALDAWTKAYNEAREAGAVA